MYKYIFRSKCWLLLPLMASAQLAMAATNTANCNPTIFSHVPTPDTAQSISIDAVALVPAAGTLPEYCDVQGHILTAALVTPTDKQVQFEVKLPTNWNSKFLMHGNPGVGGAVNFASSTVISPVIDGDTFVNGYGLAKGYTIAASNSGHVGASRIDASGFRNPDGTQNVDKLIDFGYRSAHITAVSAKNIMKAYYLKKPLHSYWMSVSNGGRQGLMEAQRHPGDFDGIIAGAPAWNLTGAWARFVSDALAQYPTDAITPVIPPSKLALIGNAVMQKCDAVDGITDNIISDPIGCHFNPLTDLPLCPANTDASTCLTAQQVNVYAKLHGPLYAPGVFSYGFLPGYENDFDPLGNLFGLANLLGAAPDLDYAFIAGTLQYWIYNNPTYDLHNFNLATNSQDFVVTPSGVNLKKIMNANKGNLSQFRSLGGKLIIVHGLADSVIPTQSSIRYYNKVMRAMGNDKKDDVLRLFLLPGVFHYNTFTTGADSAVPTHMDILGALDNWVTHGVAPNQIIASHLTANVVDMTRPICAYPKQAVLIDPNGSKTDASNFTCKFKKDDDDHTPRPTDDEDDDD